MTSGTAPLDARWLVRLRWAAIAAQVGSIAGTRYLLHAPFPMGPLVGIVGALVVVNVVLALRLRRAKSLPDGLIAANLLLDVAGLTSLLIFTGGAMNPFTTLYLLQVAIAGIMVPRRWSLAVTVGAVAAFGGLLLARPEAIHIWHSAGMFQLHVRGMWLAFALTAGALWYFVDRVSGSLRRRESELAAARLDRERAIRQSALGTVAAGAAHELNTPIGTVAILAAELSEMLAGHPEAQAQADRIREEVRRCKAILGRMRRPSVAGESERETVELAAWLEEVVGRWSSDGRGCAVELALGVRGATRSIDAEAMRQAVVSLLDNARQAMVAAGRADAIAVSLSTDDAGAVTLAVTDTGVGIAPADLAHVGEPFFSTREPGQGMGLGVYLAQGTAALHGGALTHRSGPGGTIATLTLPPSGIPDGP
jgi:two-component system sensor histidine kinase RegB